MYQDNERGYQGNFDAAAVKTDGVPAWRFQEIGREAPDNFVRQLVGHDRVHEQGARTIEELRICRLGGEGYDRGCYAMIGADGKIHSAIYVNKTYDDLHSDAHFHGDVADILSRPTQADARAPKALIFYSISSLTDARGAGRVLVNELHAFLNDTFPGAKLSTLSPLRGFDAGFTQERADAFASMSEQDKTISVITYLMTAKNDVQGFHLGNGARIADIKFGAGDRSFDAQAGEMRNHVAMVNYAYDLSTAELTANAAAYKRVGALKKTDMDDVTRAMEIRKIIMPLVSPVIWAKAGCAGPAPCAQPMLQA